MNKRIKISFLTNGHEFTAKHRLPLIQALIKRGYEVSCIAPRGSDAYLFFHNYGIACHDVFMNRRGMNILYEVRSLISIYRKYREISPHIVVQATIKPVLYGTFLSFFFNGLEVVNLITGLGYVFSNKSIKARFLRNLVLIMYRIVFLFNNHMVVFQNSNDRNTLLTNTRLKKINTELVPGSGVDPNQFPLMSINNNPSKVVLISRMIWDKGIECFVESAKIVKNIRPTTRFILVGPLDLDAPGSIPLSKFDEWHSENIVEWWGEEEDMVSIYEQATIVVLPSYYGEGVPKTLLEASLSGRPIITTDISGCREAVVDGESGYLIPPNNPNLLAEKIIDLVSNPILISKMGIAGREYVTKYYSSDIIIPQLVKIIEDSIHF